MLCGIAYKGALPLKRLDLLPIGRKIMNASSSTKHLDRIRESQTAVCGLMSGLDCTNSKTTSSKGQETTTIRTFKGDLKIYLMLRTISWDSLMEWFVPLRAGELKMSPQQAVGNQHDLSFASMHELLRDHPKLSDGKAVWANWEEELRERLEESVSTSTFASAFPKDDTSDAAPTPSVSAAAVAKSSATSSSHSRKRKREPTKSEEAANNTIEGSADEAHVESDAAVEGDEDETALQEKIAAKESNQQKIKDKRAEIEKLEAANAELESEIVVLYEKLSDDKADATSDGKQAGVKRSSSRIRRQRDAFSPTGTK